MSGALHPPQSDFASLDLLDRLHRLPTSVVLDTKQTAAFLGTSVSTLERMRVKACGPTYVQAGVKGASGVNQKCLYQIADLLDWINAQKVKGSMQAAKRKGQV